MSYRDLETWKYYSDDNTSWYISPSNTILIMKNPEADNSMCWFWRVYDNGVPNLSGIELLNDEDWNHDIGCFADPLETYNDICTKGVERAARL